MKMKTKKTFEIEIMRHGVTPAQFLAYCRKMQKKHPEMANDFDLDYFAMNGDYNRFEQDSSYTDGTPNTKPCAAEICKCKPYDHQTYIRNFDGSCYNEIIEFQFDDEKIGFGYYYTVQIDVEDEDREANTAEMLEAVAERSERAAQQNIKKAAKIREDIAKNGEWMTDYYKNNQEWEAGRLEREAAELMEKVKECRPTATPESEEEDEAGKLFTVSAYHIGVGEYGEIGTVRAKDEDDAWIKGYALAYERSGYEPDSVRFEEVRETKEAEEPRDVVTRSAWWSADSVRQSCIRNELYTCGDNDEYSAMLDYVRDNDPTDNNLLRVARDICEHSDGQTVTNIMYILYREAVYTTFCVNGDCGA